MHGAACSKSHRKKTSRARTDMSSAVCTPPPHMTLKRKPSLALETTRIAFAPSADTTPGWHGHPWTMRTSSPSPPTPTNIFPRNTFISKTLLPPPPLPLPSHPLPPFPLPPHPQQSLYPLPPPPLPLHTPN